MPSEVDLVNWALRRIGASRITSLTDGSKNANAANDIYEQIRDDLLASSEWNFATRRKKLAQDGTDPIYGYDHRYDLPSDWIRTISVHDNDAGTGTFDYREEEGHIVTSSDEVYMTYVARVTDPNKMPADFRSALAYELAKELALPVANSNTVFERMEKAALRAKGRAKATDAMGAPPQKRPRGTWVTSRSGWRD